MNSKKELKILRELKNIYEDTDKCLRRHKIRIVIYGFLGIAGVTSGIYMSSKGVVQGFCDICVMLGGMFAAIAFVHIEILGNVLLMKKYTKFEDDLADNRISELE